MENKAEMSGVEDIVLDDDKAIRVCEDQRDACEVGQIRAVLYRDVLLYYLVVKKEAVRGRLFGKVLAVPFTDKQIASKHITSLPRFTVERYSLVCGYNEDGDVDVSVQDVDYLTLYPHDYYARFDEDNFIAYSVLTDWKLSSKKDLELFL